MPIPEANYFPTQPRLQFALEPAHNAFNSLMLLNKAQEMSGVDGWVAETAAALSTEEMRRNKLITLGLHYAVVPTQSWPSLPAYIDHLRQEEAAHLRDRLLQMYISMEPHDKLVDDQAVSPANLAAIIANVEGFLAFLRARFPPEAIDIDIEIASYHLLNKPAAMQDLIVSHLSNLWDRYLAAEWTRVRPMLQTAVEAFRQVDFSDYSFSEAAAWVCGRELDQDWETRGLEQADRIIFVPSAHLGPYTTRIRGEIQGQTVLWFLFGARLPQGTQAVSADLSRSELLVRLNALADDTRLRILALLAEHERLCAQEILTMLAISQSAVSRHLRQLSATGYLIEESQAAAKCYRLNPDRIETTLAALKQFLSGKIELRKR